MMKMEGIITPIVTPFHRDAEQSINYEATEKLINHLIEHGVKGIFILGSNGEFHVIDEDEKIEMTKRVVEIVNKRVPVYVGTGCCSTRATVRLSQKVEAAGADALSVITPYFLKPTNENLYAHYKAVAESVNIPIVLYNIPKATGCPLDPELVDRLADFDNIPAESLTDCRLMLKSANVKSFSFWSEVIPRSLMHMAWVQPVL